ncbi:MAG: class I poly(R)-hydroxyalkanoic acid synthase, partial [Hyphomicrobiaceae bacterium]
MQKKVGQDGKHTERDRAADYMIGDPEEFAHNMARLVEEGSKVLAGLIERSGPGNGPYSGSGEMGEAMKTMGEVYQHWLTQPARLAEAQSDLMRGYVELWNSSMMRMMGQPAKPVVEPEPGDNRFRDPDWSENQYFDFCKQAYLLYAQWAEDLVEKTEGMDERSKQRAEFHLRQLSSAFAPSNFVFTNPEVMRETLASNADNLVKGMKHFADDIEKGGDLLKIAQTDIDAFEVGGNLAITPGKVVFQNDLLQLIQYEPTTEKVHAVPILIAPPWINKFYILDLVPQKSFLKYVVSRGFTVFVISWVNPDEELSHKTFEDYMHEGLLTAADEVCKITDQPQCNVLGYCVGGTLLGTTLAWLAAKGEAPFKSATFLAAQVDFSKAGDLLVFIDE